MIRINKQSGFASLVEVIVTTVIFITAAFGMFTTISMLKPQETESTARLRAVYMGKSVLEQLAYQVDANSWFNSASNLAVGNHVLSVSGYVVNYVVENVTTSPDLPARRVRMIVTY